MGLTKFRYHGRIEFGKEVMVSDPCYERGTWCQIKLTNMAPGEYELFSAIYGDETWGNRPAALVIVKKGFSPTGYAESIDGEVGVDSGKAGIFDDEAYPEGGFECYCKEPEICDEVSGFVSPSGYGDGGYYLYGERDGDENFAALWLNFIERREDLSYEDGGEEFLTDRLYREILEFGMK